MGYSDFLLAPKKKGKYEVNFSLSCTPLVRCCIRQLFSVTSHVPVSTNRPFFLQINNSYPFSNFSCFFGFCFFSLNKGIFFTFGKRKKNEAHKPLKMKTGFFTDSSNFPSLQILEKFLLTYCVLFFSDYFSHSLVLNKFNVFSQTLLSFLLSLQLSSTFSLLTTDTIIHRQKYKSFMSTALQRSFWFSCLYVAKYCFQSPLLSFQQRL